MAVFDFEAAWRDLLLRIADKPQWGARQLDEEMNAILRRHALPDEPGQARMLRVYGVEVHAAFLNTTRDPSPSPPGGASAGAKEAARTTDRTEEVHDGSRNEAGRTPVHA